MGNFKKAQQDYNDAIVDFKKKYCIENNCVGKKRKELRKEPDYLQAENNYLIKRFKSKYNGTKNQNAIKLAKNNLFIKMDLSSDEFKKNITDVINEISDSLKSNQIYVVDDIGDDFYCNYLDFSFANFTLLTKDNTVKDFLLSLCIKRQKKHIFIKDIMDRYINLIKKKTKELNSGISDYYITETGEPHKIKIDCSEDIKIFEEAVYSYFTASKVKQLIKNNKEYKKYLDKVETQKFILDTIPENFIDLFPKARLMHRHFILHVGDTNSGKTYQALEDYRNAATGTYLGPLRLLALEVQDKMLSQGVLCSLSTGEEENIIENATHISSTVEKARFSIKYEVAVIDEAQMINDESRGGAWTNAILGIYADRIHICMSENALEVVKKLINECGDTYELINHTRNTPLVIEKDKFSFPKSVKEHDALIVFSRNKVLSVASELEKNGIKASIIYGALPYSVRKSEIEKFIKGDTKVVVATDAIGMGLNLPIERIVFLENEKFDGKEVRPLLAPEVKQIAGRAGRRGLYETGYVNSIAYKRYIADRLVESYTSFSNAIMAFPEILVTIDGKLSDILMAWSEIPSNGIYKKTLTDREIMLCKRIETFEHLTKEEVLRLILMPFNEEEVKLFNLWYSLIQSFKNDNFDIVKKIKKIKYSKKDLSDMEQTHKVLDLYFSFLKAIGSENIEAFDLVRSKREQLSLEIIELLKEEKKEYKRCKYCGKTLSWDYPYGMCQSCYKEMHKRRHYYNDDLDYYF